jgi:hypothetical protein
LLVTPAARADAATFDDSASASKNCVICAAPGRALRASRVAALPICAIDHPFPNASRAGTASRQTEGHRPDSQFFMM